MAKVYRKYFIAIVIPEPYQSQIEEVKLKLLERYGLRGSLRSPAHITLHRPFQWKTVKEQELIDKLERFGHQQQFEITLNGFDFFAPRVLFVSVQTNPDLFSLHRQLSGFARKELGLLNEAEDERGFHPHVTVAFRDLKKALFAELQPLFEKQHFSASFAYTGFSLLRLEEKWKVLKDFSTAGPGH